MLWTNFKLTPEEVNSFSEKNNTKKRLRNLRGSGLLTWENNINLSCDFYNYLLKKYKKNVIFLCNYTEFMQPHFIHFSFFKYFFVVFYCLCYYSCPAFPPFAHLHPAPQPSLRHPLVIVCTPKSLSCVGGLWLIHTTVMMSE